MIQNIIPQHTIKLMVPAPRVVKKQEPKNPAIEALKEQLKGQMRSEFATPNSHEAKQADLIDAKATLLYAKSLNRSVRRAQPYECQDYFELQAKNAESANSLLTPREAGMLLDMTTRRFTTLSEKYNVSPEKSHGQNKLYKKEDVENMRRNYGPFYFD
jgi:hypothetical protein